LGVANRLQRRRAESQVATAVIEFAQQFLLRVDRYHGFAVPLERLDLRVEMLELGVAIMVFATFLGRAVRVTTTFSVASSS
jgi:hypothetical protein